MAKRRAVGAEAVGAGSTGRALATSWTGLSRAWLAHFVTASGAVFGLLALASIARNEWRLALLWMTAALAVDAADGTLARWARVQAVLPGFDGALLDNIVDFLNYAVVPAFFLYEAGLLPPGWGAAGAAAAVLASAYQFCRVDAKTEDHYFTGFPSYWNVVVFYFLVLRLDAWAALGVLMLLCALVFVPFRYVYPSRTRPYRLLTLTLTSVWGLLCLAVLARYPLHPPALAWASLLYVPYYVIISVLARRRDTAAADA